MTWSQKTIIRILLLVAKMIAEDPQIKKDIDSLALSIRADG